MKSGITVIVIGLLLASCGSGSPQPDTPKASGPLATTKAPDENAALDALRKTNEAQSTYFKINRRYALAYDELIEAHLLASEPSPAQTGYEFKLRPAADAQTYRLSVSPADSTAAAARHFFTDQTGVIRSEAGKDASSDSPVLR